MICVRHRAAAPDTAQPPAADLLRDQYLGHQIDLDHRRHRVVRIATTRTGHYLGLLCGHYAAANRLPPPADRPEPAVPDCPGCHLLDAAFLQTLQIGGTR